uniref:G protein-coupled receptor 20 n=1 Tax=Neogobius melanostomus TaxID=47308 RepID=A0A8C6WJF2_9GOBI
ELFLNQWRPISTLAPSSSHLTALRGTSAGGRHISADYSIHVTFCSLQVCNSLMLVLGVILNSLALYIFCGTFGQSSASVVYTINLAVADLLVALSLPARIALYHSKGSCMICSYIHNFSYFVNMYCSILFLTSICIDRYLAVVHASSTLHRWRTTGAAKGVSCTVWLTAIIVTYSFQVKANTTYSLLPALFYLTVLEFLLPLLAVIGFTLRVACFLSSHHGPMHRKSRDRRTRAIGLLTTVLVVFTICFTPFHVRQILVYFRVWVGAVSSGQGAGHILAYHITVTLSSLNSCLDPIVYCFVTDSFKRVHSTGYSSQCGHSYTDGTSTFRRHYGPHCVNKTLNSPET